MPLAHWCVLVVALALYALSVAARSWGSRSGDVRGPRGCSESLSGWRKRAHLAHLNALVVAFGVARAMHAALCIADRSMPRSHAWRLGILCVIARFVDAAIYGRH